MSNKPPLQSSCSPNLPHWLIQKNLSFAFTTYQTNRLFCVGYNSECQLALHERLFDKPMGLFTQDDRLFMSTRYQIWQMDNLLGPGEIRQQCDRLFIPKYAHTTGDLNVHDIALDSNGDLLFVNTDFSCLARLSPNYSFEAIWQPPFISKLAAEDRCHLNGLAMRDGKPAFMTTCSLTDNAAGWRDQRISGGAVLDLQSNGIIATGLSMPHSPRWYKNKLWLLNSGTGELGYIDLDQGQFIPLTFCPGFVRGLSFFENYAFVGLSKLRSKAFSGLALEERLNAEGKSPQCGLMIIDLETGQVVNWLQLEGVVEELFDVVVLPGVRQPQSVGFQSDEIERLVTFAEADGIVVTKPTVQRPSMGGTAPVAGVPRQIWEADVNTDVTADVFTESKDSAPLITADLTTLKFQQVYHLTPENLADYDNFTYPSLQQRWQHQPQRGELCGVSATLRGEMVAFAIAELLSNQAADIVSLYVAPAYRQQGIGGRLVNFLEQGLIQTGCHTISIAYLPTTLTQRALIPLLKRLGWAEPLPLHQLRRSTKSLTSSPKDTVKAITPDSASEQLYQGRTLAKQGDYQAAVHCFQSAIAQNPRLIAAYNQLGNAYQALGQFQNAIASYRKLLDINPSVAQAHCNLGAIWQQQEKIEAAITAYQKAIEIDPTFVTPYLNVGRLWMSLHQWQKAKAAFKLALEQQPQSAEAYFEMGMLQKHLGNIKRAIACLQLAVQYQPDYVEAIHNLGCLWMVPSNFEQAQDCFKQVIKLQPDYPLVYGNLGQILVKQKSFPEALACFDRALQLNPEDTNLIYQREHLRISLCDWDNYDLRMRQLKQRLEHHSQDESSSAILPLYINSFPMPPALHQSLAKKLARQVVQTAQPFQEHCRFSLPSPPSPKIKLGYLSADFRKHAVGTLIYQLFQYHNRSAFEVYAYSLVDTADEFTESIQSGCDHFVNLSPLSSGAAAQRINDDGIHILIDLAGYTSMSRPEILALRPAPLQIQYLGHPDTTGADFIQYIVADRWLIPSELAAHYTEQVMELPHAWVTSSLPQIGDAGSRESFGLPSDGVVFCCFNRSDKYDPTIYDTWMRILERVPDSVLWLIETNGDVTRTLRQRAEAQGVKGDRVIFTPPMPLRTYLAAYQCADVFLDTLVYNAGATGIHAIQMGVPMVTTPGQTFAARMGASICAAAGLEALICDNLTAYEEKAVELASHPEQLQTIRQRLHDQHESRALFQPQQWVTQFEDLLTRVYSEIGNDNKSPAMAGVCH